MLCALAMLCHCTSTITVKFNLKSTQEVLSCPAIPTPLSTTTLPSASPTTSPTTPLSTTTSIPKGAFAAIDKQEKECRSFLEMKDLASSAPKEACEITLSHIRTWEEYEYFNAFWKTDLVSLPAEDGKAPSLYQKGLTQDLFVAFLLTADRLGIQGMHARFFITNMVRYGLLGKYSKDITDNDNSQDLEHNTSHDIFKLMLQDFLKQTGFACRSIIHPSTGQTTLLMEKAGTCHRKISSEYKGLPQTARMRTVLYSRLSPRKLQEKERNEAVLGWLLLNMGGSSVDIQYPIQVVSEDISELKSTIQSFTKENKKGACVYVEGLAFTVKYNTKTSLIPALLLVPGLFCLDLSMSPVCCASSKVASSLIRSITLCKSLKVLKIREEVLESALIMNMVESLPSIEQLCLFCTPLENTVIDSLVKLTCLESLDVLGALQPSAVVQRIVKHLPLLKRLGIKCKALDLITVGSFKACKRLESLDLFGEPQPNAAVQALVKHISSIKDLRIECKALDHITAGSFEECTRLETLTIFGEHQPSAVVEELPKRVPLLKELAVVCQSLEHAAAECFKAYSCLEKLEMSGEEQPSAIVHALLRNLPFIKELRIECDVLNSRAAKSFEGCKNLETLEMAGKRQPSSAVTALVKHLPSIKALNLNFDARGTTNTKFFKGCKRLETLRIFGNGSASFLAELLTALPSLQHLRIEIDLADFFLADELRKYPNLYSLKLTTRRYTPGFIARYLKVPLPNLMFFEMRSYDKKNLNSEEDNSAVKKATDLLFG
ncbi:hypothetical protein NECID01_1866 [Nematocida sp. AWRm77]|nr:hypothetical protein NECID01_1866 [Nematocida sp. AWRm77]